MKFCQLLRTYISTYYFCNFLHITLFLYHVSWTSKAYSFHRPSGKAPAILSENYVYRNFLLKFFCWKFCWNYFVSFNIKLKRTDIYTFEHRSSSSIIFSHLNTFIWNCYKYTHCMLHCTSYNRVTRNSDFYLCTKYIKQLNLYSWQLICRIEELLI